MALHRYGDFRVEVFYFDSPCRCFEETYFCRQVTLRRLTMSYDILLKNFVDSLNSVLVKIFPAF